MRFARLKKVRFQRSDEKLNFDYDSWAYFLSNMRKLLQKISNGDQLLLISRVLFSLWLQLTFKDITIKFDNTDSTVKIEKEFTTLHQK